MNDALFAAQEAAISALAASAEVQALLGNPARIFDHVPPGAAFPYLVTGTVAAKPYDDKDRTGFIQTLAFEAWSRYRGSMEAKDILQAVYDTLHRGSLTVAGQVFISCECAAAQVMPDGDGLTCHGLAHYTVITQSS